MSSRIRQELLKRAREFNIRLEDVSIVNLTFGQEFTRAVEQKQIAQQDAERAKYIVEMVRRPSTPLALVGRGDSADTLALRRSPPLPPVGVVLHRQAEHERQANVIRAEGEAEAATTIGRALDRAGEAFVALRKIETAREVATTLGQGRNVTYLPSGGGNGMLLNVNAQ